MTRDDIIARRREFRICGYRTLAEVGFDGDWVTPYQITSASETGPVLVALHWLDARSVEENRKELMEKGYLPEIPFNIVVSRALKLAGLCRRDIYVTQAFHLLPIDNRSQRIQAQHLYESFNAITRYEVEGRTVIALGKDVARACRQAGIEPFECVVHPSARHRTNESKAEELSEALKRARQRS